MKKLILILLTLVSQLAFSQSNGLIPDDEAYENTPEAERDTSPDRGPIPKSVDLRRYCPVPGDQGDQPACVSWSLAHALTIQNAIAKGVSGAGSVEKITFSEAYIHNYLKQSSDCDLGLRFSEGLNLLRSKGNCYTSDFPYSSANCTPAPGSAQHSKAYAHRIKSYRKVFKKDASDQDKIDLILEQLAKKKPVIIAAYVPYNFRSFIPKKPEQWLSQDLHSMVIVGYNEQYEYFIVMNSYGSSWGENGFFRKRYKVIVPHLEYAYVLDAN